MHITGGCLCGAVRYEGEGEPTFAGHCHCVDCRKSSGSGHSSHLGVAEADIAITGAVTVYDRPADSGNMVSRGFCPVCGAGIFARNAEMPGALFLRASSLDDMEVFKPQMVVFAGRRPSWDQLDAQLPHFDRMPPGR